MKNQTLSAERARELLDYDPLTGGLTWRAPKHPAIPGCLAGYTEGNGYRRVRVGGVLYPHHRLIWLIVHGSWPAGEVDHINGIPLDNRISNLRDVSRACNMQNQHGPQKGSVTGLLGVTVCGVKFKSGITVGGTTRYLGTYATPEEAHQAYLSAKRELHTGCTI